MLIIGGSMCLTKQAIRLLKWPGWERKQKRHNMTTKQIHETHIKIAFFAMLLIMLAAIYVAIPDLLHGLPLAIEASSNTRTIDYLRSFGV